MVRSAATAQGSNLGSSVIGSKTLVALMTKKNFLLAVLLPFVQVIPGAIANSAITAEWNAVSLAIIQNVSNSLLQFALLSY